MNVKTLVPSGNLEQRIVVGQLLQLADLLEELDALPAFASPGITTKAIHDVLGGDLSTALVDRLIQPCEKLHQIIQLINSRSPAMPTSKVLL